MTVLVIGTFDTKKVEYEYLIDELLKHDVKIIAMNIGIFADQLAQSEIEYVSNQQVVDRAGKNLDDILKDNDRGLAMNVMAQGAAVLSTELFKQNRIDGVIGMGGSGGSSVVAAAMRSLPIGVPKVLLSTMAGGETSAYVGCKDIVMIPSITDISGLNRISRRMISLSAAAIAGMIKNSPFTEPEKDTQKIIAASMFGNTTDCVDRCREMLANETTEIIVFHATGTGGRTMESLVDDGYVDGCLDITTTEIADEVCGGILSAGPDRLGAPGRRGIPHLVVPGCIDMANFGAIDTVPKRYRESGRQLYEWNPAITLMRTSVEENIQMGKIFAEKLNASTGPVHVLIPLNGVSILDADGERFCDREADQAMFDTLKANLSDKIEVTELNQNINAPEFSTAAVEIFQTMMAE